MIIGDRIDRRDGFSRKIITRTLQIVLRLIFGVRIADANTPFRLMNAGTLKQFISKIPPDYNLSNVLLSVIYAKYNLRVKFLPITFRPRQGGVNSINLRRIFSIGLNALRDFIALSRKI